MSKITIKNNLKGSLCLIGMKIREEGSISVSDKMYQSKKSVFDRIEKLGAISVMKAEPVSEKKAEAPKVEKPKVESPKVEKPKVEEPKKAPVEAKEEK